METAQGARAQEGPQGEGLVDGRTQTGELVELLTAATLEVIYKRLRQKDLALVKLNLRCNVIWEIVRAGDRTGRSQAIALNTTLTRLDPSVPIRCWRGEGSAVIHETPMSQACCDDSCDVCL